MQAKYEGYDEIELNNCVPFRPELRIVAYLKFKGRKSRCARHSLTSNLHCLHAKSSPRDTCSLLYSASSRYAQITNDIESRGADKGSVSLKELYSELSAKTVSFKGMAEDAIHSGHRGLISAAFNNLYKETGLRSLFTSTFDVKILCLQRFVRQFAYGQSTLILVSFFTELNFSKERIGIFMTLTLAGDVMISFFLALYADRVGRRAIISFGAVLMVASGATFALSSSYWILLAAAVAGVISPR